jgi:hypothetical protein
MREHIEKVKVIAKNKEPIMLLFNVVRALGKSLQEYWHNAPSIEGMG